MATEGGCTDRTEPVPPERQTDKDTAHADVRKDRLAEMEGVGEFVGGNFVGLGEIGLQLELFIIHLEEPLVNERQPEVISIGILTRERIQTVDIGIDSFDDPVALDGVRIVRDA
jgi:hypothetical protein